MKHSFLHFDHIRIMDDSTSTKESPMESFAIDDALCLSVSENLSPPAARLWVHEKTIVLGIPDSRLPYLGEGISYLKANGYNGIVRNSGGLAVVLDEGVLNVSFVFPDAKKISIHAGYEAMVEFILELFRDEQKAIEAFEVVGSYCPGDYDLSINGKKFAGISQRRVKDGTAVQIYLCVEGSGEKRATLVKGFYDLALKGEPSSFTYPEIVPHTMASLQQLFGRAITVGEVSKRILDKLKGSANKTSFEPLHDKELEWFDKRLELMKIRNDKAFE